jgi:undecaprenyl-diphosphatase
MNILMSIFLGAVQGITEILPISSTAHLILFPWFFQVPSGGLAFDVALHLGSLIAVIIAFRREWLSLAKSAGRLIGNKLKPADHNQKMIYYLVLASIPAGVVGIFFDEIIENALRSPYVIVVTLITFGLVLLIAEKVGAQKKTFEKITLRDALLIGFAQMIALIPGTSRSGITISAGLFAGLKKEEAAKFSFMLSAPAILGAAIVKLPNLSGSVLTSTAFWLGMLSSFIFSLLAIIFILKFVQKYSYKPFVYYRFVLALLIMIFLIWR